jgi:DNA-binding transcriptional ArsR family regulator
VEIEKKQDVINQRIEQMREHAPNAAGLMKALGNESRLMILCTLAEGERSVSLSEGPADKVIHLLHDIYCGIDNTG